MSQPQLTILVVEDDDFVRSLLQHVLSTSDYNVIASGEAGMALKLARQHQPDLILTDITMPGINGIDLIKMIRQDEALNNTPILALTAYRYILEEEVMNAGANVVLAKPFDLTYLLSEIERLTAGDEAKTISDPTPPAPCAPAHQA